MQSPLKVCGLSQTRVLHAMTQGPKLPPSSGSPFRAQKLGHRTWPLPHFHLAVTLSTDAHVLLARFSVLSLTWRGAWRMWGASEMMVGNIASAHWHFGDGCGEGLTEGPRS